MEAWTNTIVNCLRMLDTVSFTRDGISMCPVAIIIIYKIIVVRPSVCPSVPEDQRKRLDLETQDEVSLATDS